MGINRILFIDDDRSLLNTLDRNLGLDYDVTLAEGGQTALELVRAGQQYSVIIVDMRMPGMDGIETIKALREIAKDTVYMMLTGNQDITTAMHAVNEGQVFRFLNKPCEIAEIRRSIDAAQRQYDLVTGEKELLHETFVGAIGVMTDMIELQSNRLFNSEHMVSSLTAISERLKIEVGWEERIAARIALIGLTLLTPEERQMMEEMELTEEKRAPLVAKICQTSAKLIERIPRLGGIAKILRCIPKADGWMSPSQPHHFVAATILRIVIYWNLLSTKGLRANAIVAELHGIFPKMTDSLRAALNCLDDFQDSQIPRDVLVRELAEGMVAFDDIIDENGLTVVSRGRRLTGQIIENLARRFPSEIASVRITAGSCAGLNLAQV